MDYYKEALKVHEQNKGKLAIVSKVPLKNKDDLSVAYTPGVAMPCIEISKNSEDVYKYTSKCNTVAVVTDGSAVLGLGNIGAKAAIPVMEGKAVLFKSFADIDAIPICIETQDTEEIISIAKNISPTFGGINLEDISAPRCFEIEARLQEALDIPVFHDDQHGTAIVSCAALINALKVVHKKIDEVKIVINGAGAAGSAILKMLIAIGAKNMVICDRSGIISKARKDELNEEKLMLAEITNQEVKGSLTDAIQSADIFIGVSSPKTVTAEMVKTMNKDAIIFAMSNPEPEIMPDLALEAGARIVGTGRSDFPNQINNVLAFPGVFKGALSAKAERITESMKVAAAYAIAGAVQEERLTETGIIPSVFQEGIADAVAAAVADAWHKEAEEIVSIG
ncbi:NAD(P)-dependent malic enzyme [Sinanaerobacter chloroacetimidivorans]|uniref:NAD-dependent malic enzyme n=1 Tax=Sinanaerobacter chloroacetimidivorans TaxID=2818044 RepID=A0A8J7W162_9FIRM|nr:malic enzyme-like NAD(P)-binding protein [Sinanaerobacter chloroacetimidivorans]MBR0597300.1 NAD-dependent malic enzyme [Sinanaerobacter chloroacetimidivorans]